MIDIDRYIDGILFDHSSALEQGDADPIREPIRELIRDVLNEVRPERLDPSAFSLDSSFNRPAPFDQTWDSGHNDAVNEMERKAKEIGL
jgi:hypothetical protein